MSMLSEPKGAGFTLREVARRAQVSHAAPYKHFPEKAVLMDELMLMGFDRLRSALADAIGTAKGDFASTFLAAASAYLEFGRQNPALYRLMFGGEYGTNSVHLDPRALDTLDLVVDVIEQGQCQGKLRGYPARGQATACWAQIHGLTMLELDGLLRPEKVGENAIEIALQTLLEGILR